MRPRRSQREGNDGASAESAERTSVFLFLACPEEVLASFEEAVRAAGAAEQVEPIAVASYPTADYLEAFLEENGKDVACVTVHLDDPEQAIDLIEIVAREAPGALILGTDDGRRAESLLPALRAGAKDVIAPPYDLSEVLRCSFRASGPQDGGQAKMACFLPAQGGNGASTISIHFAAALAAELGRADDAEISPVLLLDLDFHSDSAAFWLNKRPGYSLLDVLEGPAAAKLYWKKVTTPWNGIDLLSPPPPDRYVSEQMLESLPDVIAAARKAYQWVVVDLPPTLFSSSRKLLPTADLVYLVCTPEARALYLAKRRIADLRGLGIAEDVLRVTLNRAGAKRAIEAATAEKSIGAPVQFSVENDYLEISSAYSERRLAEPGSAPGRQFRAMARAGLGLEEAVVERRSGWRRLVGFG